MKISFVTASLMSGGTERVLTLLANNLAQRNHQVEVICLNKPDVFYPIDNRVKCVFAEKEITSHSLLLKFLWLRRHIIKSKPDVVIPFMVAVYTFTLLCLINVHIPVISAVRNDPKYSNRIKKILRGLLLPRSTHVVVQTESIKSYFSKRIQKKTTVIYNPVNEDFLRLKPSKRKPIIISVGRLYPQKNQIMMIRAFSKIANEFPNYTLVIYGEGPLRGKLEKEIVNLDMKKRIFLPGRSTNIPEELNCASVFCLSSNYEGMSNSLIEAICAGLPIVSTKISGTEDFITEGENGFLVDIGDEENMALSLRNLLKANSQITDFGNKNRLLKYLFEPQTIVQKWENLIVKVVNEYK